MATDEDGNLDFSSDPHAAYTVPDNQIFMWGIRIWRAYDDQGEPKVFWHIDGEGTKAVEMVGTLELVKMALADQQIEQWREDGPDEIDPI